MGKNKENFRPKSTTRVSPVVNFGLASGLCRFAGCPKSTTRVSPVVNFGLASGLCRFAGCPKSTTGFTLVEILMVMAVTAVIVGMGAGAYMTSFRSAALKNAAEESVTLLRFAQQRAMSQEQGNAWGVRVSNASSADPYLEVFVNPYAPANVVHHYDIPGTVGLQSPASGITLDITFAKMTGLPSTSTVLVLVNRGSSQTKSVTINQFGAISTD